MLAKDREDVRLIISSYKQDEDCKNLQSQVNMITVTKILTHVIEAITGFNESVTFFQWLRSLRSNRTENQELKEDDVLKLQTSLQCLRDTIPVMHVLINRAEWKSHDRCVEQLLPKLKAACYDAEDLLEDFRYHELKVQIEGSATSSEPGTESFRHDIEGHLDRLNRTKERLDTQSRLLQEIMGLHQAPLRFDRSVRLETTCFPKEAKIIGRDDEIKDLIRLLGVTANNRRDPSGSKRKRSAIRSSAGNQVCATLGNNEATTITGVSVLPIVGIGGVGKTTLAQTIYSHPQVTRHFDVTGWICVSDDFDVNRLTKVAIEQFPGRVPTKDNLNSLQSDLAYRLNNRRFLIVLDDMWEENEERWKTFCAPFKHVLQGSMMLVTTRSRKVAQIVGTMDPFPLEGLKDNVFRNFFKLCVFRPDSSNINSELERIGEQILPKLKGSPLAAKTIGRLLGMSDDPVEWNMILNSQLWELEQESYDILPALRLSYMYLPFHLKRCFSFCAVYPKDYNFVKEDLAQIWVAEGFVEPQCNIPLQQTACKYFEELAYLSFFQEFHGKYVIHDLIHDMAQLVSKDECFTIKEKKDLERIPENIRHLSVLECRDFKCSDLESLCKQTKLRTLLCNMPLKGKIGNNVMEKWCAELLCMRVMFYASISKSGLPDSISNMKNLRYLKISKACLFDSLPATFCHLYNLQLLSAKKCRIKVIPKGFSNLINLQKFELRVLKIDARLLNNFNPIAEDLYLCNLCEISKDQAAKIELMKKKDTFNVTLDWSEEIHLSPRLQVHNEIEVFEALHPPIDIKFVCLVCYPGEYLPSWSNGFNNAPTTIFSSLTEIAVTKCPRLSSLEQFLQPAHMPATKKMEIRNCTSLESVPVEQLWGLPSLEELVVRNCPKINSQRLVAPSLKMLFLENSGNLGDDIDCRSLTTFHLSSYHLASLTFNIEKVPLLTNLTIQDCKGLETLNNGDCWPSLQVLKVSNCPKINSQRLLAPSLTWLYLENSGNLGDDIDCHSLITFQLTRYSLASLTFNREKVPLLTCLTIKDCRELDTLNGGWSTLKMLSILRCPRLNLENGIVLPSSLQKLDLCKCGYFSARYLENLTSLESLKMDSCKHIEYIPRDIWSSSLKSLQELKIKNCEDLVSIGGQEAIAHIPKVHIETCPKLKAVLQPFRRGY